LVSECKNTYCEELAVLVEEVVVVVVVVSFLQSKTANITRDTREDTITNDCMSLRTYLFCIMFIMGFDEIEDSELAVSGSVIIIGMGSRSDCGPTSTT